MRFLLDRRKEELDVESRNWLKKTQRDRLNEKHKRKLVKRTEEEILRGKKNTLQDEAKTERTKVPQEGNTDLW
jgi:hypothetical protein